MHGNDRSWNSVVDFIPDATLVINQNGKVIAWNRAMEKLTGVRAKNILGKGNYEYAIPFYGKRRPILIDVALNPDCIESVQTHYAILTTDGVFHSAESYTPGLKKNPDTHLSATASLLRDTDGYIIGAIECMRDDTGRKRLEKALVHSEKQYRELVDNSPVGIYRTTLAGKILYANQAMVDILAYNSPDELINLKSFIFYENVRDRRKLITRLRKDGKLNNYPIELITKTGAIRHVIVSASREQGVISGIIVDITQQKLAVEENQKLQAQLMRAQKMEALGTLAGGIAHDFNNLLMGIQGNTELALFDLEPEHPNIARLIVIGELVESGSRLTQQLLGFACGGKYEIVTIDVNSILKKNISMFNRTDKEISVTMNLQEDLWAVDADQGQIEQVFLNILINAGQAMPGGGELYIETRNIVRSDKDVMAYGLSAGKYVMVSFTDAGIGMDAETLERIFDPFFTTKKPERGTGLGLASAYGIVKNHGGYIRVESNLGEGSIFRVHLPATINEIVSISDQLTGELLKGTETILIVDDERNVAAVTNDILEDLGYQVFLAGSGQEALSIYMEKKSFIDLVILDMIMPGMSGEMTYEALRNMNPDVKVILASGYSLDDQTRSIMEKGCQGFIQKPFRMHDISRKIREVLDESTM